MEVFWSICMTVEKERNNSLRVETCAIEKVAWMVYLQRSVPFKLQMYPYSSLQVELHPSPLIKLPSSHCSLPLNNPSPHIA